MEVKFLEKARVTDCSFEDTLIYGTSVTITMELKNSWCKNNEEFRNLSNEIVEIFLKGGAPSATTKDK